jgi:hypothetical protein
MVSSISSPRLSVIPGIHSRFVKKSPLALKLSVKTLVVESSSSSPHPRSQVKPSVRLPTFPIAMFAAHLMPSCDWIISQNTSWIVFFPTSSRFEYDSP